MPLEINRIKNIYYELHKLYGEDVSDEKYDEDYKTYSKDINFLRILCWGPWRGKRQSKVEEKILKYIKESSITQLTDIMEEHSKNMGYPLEWQQVRVLSLAKFLKDRGEAFEAFLTELEKEYADNSMKIIEELGKATNEGKPPDTHKIISAFVRDIMKRDAFPLDSRVKEMVGFLGLPNDEELIIKLCRKNRVDPRVLNRMLYLHNGGDAKKYKKGYCGNGCKNNENECPIKSECYTWTLRE